MLERNYTIPILFGICLGLIFAGVRVSATALNAALGGQREAALVSLERFDRNGAEIEVLGKRLHFDLTRGPGELARELAGRAGDLCGKTMEKAGYLYGECLSPAGRLVRSLNGLALEGRDRLQDLWGRWREKMP